MSSKIPVGVLGATGAVGQRFIDLLSNHSMFEIVSLAASERSSGSRYGSKVNWILDTPIPETAEKLPIDPVTVKVLEDRNVRIVFSALPSSIATDIETALGKAGFFVSSNASSHRMDPLVPILIPDINPDHIELIRAQREAEWNGSLITNSNCTTSGLIFGLKPLMEFGINDVHVTTLQALSGAGYPGVPSLQITENVVPYISGEEEKMAEEPRKILGELVDNHIKEAEFPISATCTRVPVINGHLETIYITFENPPTVDEVVKRFTDYTSEPQEMKLPSAPIPPIIITSKPDRPQPRIDRLNGQPDTAKGMAITIGKIKPIPRGIRFTLLVHNTIRGAAGGSILAAEYAVKKNLI